MSASHLPARTLDEIAPGLLPTIGLTVIAAVGASLCVPGHPEVAPLAIVAVGLGALLLVPSVTRTGRRWWLAGGPIVYAVLVALLVAGTGGADSAYQDLLAVLLVSSAVLKRPVPLAVDAAVVVAAALAPLAYASPGPGYLADLAVDVMTWIVVALTARLLAQSLVGATSRLAESDRRFHLLANDVPAIVYRRALGSDGRLTWLSDQTMAIVGFPAQAFVDDPDLALSRVPAGDRGAFLSAQDDARDGGSGITRYRFDRADGTRVWLEDRWAPVTDEDGRPVAVLGMVVDVSSRAAAEQAQQDAHEYDRIARLELGRLLAAQRSFVQGISHELRTPLTSVAGFASVLASQGDAMPAEQREHVLDRLLVGTRRLTELVDDLVDMDRLVGDPGTRVTRAPTDVRPLVENAIRTLPTSHHAVTVEGDPGEVAVDSSMLERIVRHLVGNGLRHTPAGSTVTCGLAVGRDGLRLVVEDDGPGVPDDLRGRLFEPFTQGASATEAPSPGTGIGLALVASLAQAHDGRTWYETAAGGGARFVVVLGCPG